MKLFLVILFIAFIGTLFAEIPIRNRRGLPGVSLKDPNPTAFTSFKQQYFQPRQYWGGYGGNYGNNYNVNSYGVGTYGGYRLNYGNQFGYNNYGAGATGVRTGYDLGLGGSAYGK